MTGPRHLSLVAPLDGQTTVMSCQRCGAVFDGDHTIPDFLAHACSRPVTHLTDTASVAAFAAHVLEACDKSPEVASPGVAAGPVVRPPSMSVCPPAADSGAAHHTATGGMA